MRSCREGCGWSAFKTHPTCCTVCRGPEGPHADDCGRKNQRLRPACAKGCGRPSFGRYLILLSAMKSDRSKLVDRAEQMRQRLQARAAGKSSTSGGPRIPCPAPKAIVAGGKSLAWLLEAVCAACIVISLLTGYSSVSAFFSVIHAGYFANFSRSDLAFQVRVLYLSWVVLSLLVGPLRLAILLSLLGVLAADLAIGYNAAERLLYIMPWNRSEDAEEFSIDFVIRVFTEPPNKKSQVFSLKPVVSGAEALGVNSGKKGKKN
eukprot:TRINITY_DN2400_c0_g1_i2.p1 TRINITY_DN2400_c0_g1~~TRINITY_DN2400_c0_g1_i2.p1  ORF type:complete len:262 (+),score=38.42 TRINITY_DN2400_c0_g1_i2:118-903(+)